MKRYKNVLDKPFENVAERTLSRRRNNQVESEESSNDEIENAQWQNAIEDIEWKRAFDSECQDEINDREWRDLILNSSSADWSNDDSDATIQNINRNNNSNEEINIVSDDDSIQNSSLPTLMQFDSSSLSEERQCASENMFMDRFPSSSNGSLQDIWNHDLIEEVFSEIGSDDDFNISNEDIDEADVTSNSNINNATNFIRLQKFLDNEENNSSINTASVNNCEIVLAVLKFSLVHNLSQSAIADLFKMLNSLFGINSLPCSRYLINVLFTSHNIVTYHAVCPTCKKYISTFERQDRYITCFLCNKRFGLKHPLYNHFFVTIDVKNEIIHLLKDNHDYYSESVSRRIRNFDQFTDFTDGIMYDNFIHSLSLDDRQKFATSTFNVDGAPVFESSKFAVWPIQMIINELPYYVRSSKPIVCGLWFGKDKPDMNVFLKPFTVYMNSLSETGIKYKINNEEHVVKIYPVCSCVDSVARAPMQGLTQFNGHFGCSWCLHPGIYVKSKKKGSIKYTLLDEVIPVRTEIETIRNMQESLQSQKTVHGVKRSSCLINLHKFNIISGFVPDYMHNVCLGIANQFLDLWLSKRLPYSLSTNDVELLNNLIMSIKAPIQVERLSRSITDRKFWKAKEYENWLLFFSIPILQNFHYMEKYTQHWSLLVEAMHILLKENISRVELLRADNLLKEFVVETEFLYSKSAMTYNLHQLLHLAQSVANWGPLWSHSGYCFESNNGKLLKQIHAAKGVIHQICRTITMKQCELILSKHIKKQENSAITDYIFYLENKCTKKTIKLSYARYFGVNYKPNEKWVEELQLSPQSRCYSKMVKNGCLYMTIRRAVVRSNNSYALTEEGQYIQFADFIVDETKVKEFTICRVLQVESYSNKESFPLKKVVDILDTFIAIPTKSIKIICVCIKISHIMYICALPNAYWD